MPALAIETQQLTRRFGEQTAVDRVSLRMPYNSIYAFLGPNGAGKTTFIRMLLDLIRPDGGEVLIGGQPLRRNRIEALRQIGSLVEQPSLYPHLTGWENLNVIRRVTGIAKERLSHVLALVKLEGDAKRLVRTYSLGMRQRLGIAIALLRAPSILILDEPSNALDPSGIQEVRELIRVLVREHGITVFLSSHLLSEVEQIATHVAIVNLGQLIFDGSLRELHQRKRTPLRIKVASPDRAALVVASHGLNCRQRGESEIEVDTTGEAQVAAVNEWLVAARVPVYRLTADPDLEDVFLHLTRAPLPQTQAVAL